MNIPDQMNGKSLMKAEHDPNVGNYESFGPTSSTHPATLPASDPDSWGTQDVSSSHYVRNQHFYIGGVCIFCSLEPQKKPGELVIGLPGFSGFFSHLGPPFRGEVPRRSAVHDRLPGPVFGDLHYLCGAATWE